MNNTKTRDCMFRGKMIICDQYPCSRSCGWHPETEQRRKKKLRQKEEAAPQKEVVEWKG